MFLRMDAALSEISAEALGQMVQVILLWSDLAFATRSPLVLAAGVTVLRPEIGDLIRADYDRVLPVASRDAAHTLR